ncbi:MAG: hypothetical protein GY909_12520 [Oligoflexia bacterium]|nr:hypothetical protein [Oligoflexia bacterium]
MKKLLILGLLLTSVNIFANNAVGESDSNCVDQVQSSRFSGETQQSEQPAESSEDNGAASV